jgi:hypothetical protein
MRRFREISAGILMCIALLTGAGICQEEKRAEPSSAQGGPKVESIYGEVLAVNDASSSLTVQYYDYDADEEKNLDVGLDKDSRLENASSLKDVKVGDWVDVSYSLGEGGKKVAKTVKVEKAEESTAGGKSEEEGEE